MFLLECVLVLTVGQDSGVKKVSLQCTFVQLVLQTKGYYVFTGITFVDVYSHLCKGMPEWGRVCTTRRMLLLKPVDRRRV